VLIFVCVDTDEVKAFIKSINHELAKSLEEAPPSSVDCSELPKCEPVGNSRIKTE